MEKTSTRREFLKLGCKSIAGAAVSMTVLGFLGYSNAADVTGFPLATGLLISDGSRCTGCRRCELVCTMFNDGKADPKTARLQVGRNYNFGRDGITAAYRNGGAGVFGNFMVTADTCKQCKEPACAAACPVGAIQPQAKTGTRVVNESKCVGCGACVGACPWSVIAVDAETKKSKKCVLCYQCVKNCPTGSLKLIPWQEVKAAVRRNA
ncbi:MAG: ferredoxin-like protein [Flavobacteriales bacterium]|nr:ferredoxin-like protein [Flavobacteriales bacterium]